MKQTKFLTIALWVLLLLPQIVLAQQNNNLLKMKPGDWFEMKVNGGSLPKDKELYEYLVRYRLMESKSNGNKTYQLTFERIKMKFLRDKGLTLGYDTYYPQFKQGGKQVLDKPVFLVDVDGLGNTIKITPQSNVTNVRMNEVTFRKTYGGTGIEIKLMHTKTAGIISESITKSIAANNTTFNGQLIGNRYFSALLTGASFPIQKNTLITGRITNLTDSIKHTMKLYLEDSNLDIHFAKDGSFNIPVLLTGSSDVIWKYKTGQKVRHISMLVNPGDTLVVNANGADFVNSIQFAGNGAKIAALGVQTSTLQDEIKIPEFSYHPKNFSAADFMKKQAAEKKVFEEVTSLYEASVTSEALTYYQDKFAYKQSYAKLRFLFSTTYRSADRNNETFEGFPLDFFKSIDTLPVQMKDYAGKSWYTDFIHDYNLYLSDKIGTVNGGGYGFLSKYAMSLTYLKMFPLYFSLTEAFEQELEESNWQKAQILVPYYHDFINNCSDTTLTKIVKEKWEILNNWAPGNQSPLKGFKLADGKMLDLNKFKGKILSLTFNFDDPDKIEYLLKRIKMQDSSKVHFVIAQLKTDDSPNRIGDLFKGMSNVTYVEVNEDDEIREKKVLLDFFDIRTYIFDRELKVVEDNINDRARSPIDHVFEEAMKKATKPSRMGKEQKAALINIIGWSAGSILFSFFIGLWVYKVRLASMKRKEAVKRQIKELEIKAIRSQMNPHFLFNALNSIQSLISNMQYKEANFYLEKFSLLMRRVLNNSEKIFITLSDEIEAVKLYVELEKLRFNFSFSIHIDDNVNTDLIEIPGMLIQPLVENAIVHGLAQKGNAGRLNIDIQQEKFYLKITVRDNGRGLPTGSAVHNGFGLKLVKERLNLLSGGEVNGKFTLSSNLDENSTGTTAILIIPID